MDYNILGCFLLILEVENSFGTFAELGLSLGC
jgi:hypothetical protein